MESHLENSVSGSTTNAVEEFNSQTEDLSNKEELKKED